MKRNMLAILCAAVMTASVPLPVFAADTAAVTDTLLPDGTTGTTEEGYWFLELGDDQDEEKNFKLGEGGCFACNWSKVRSYHAEAGKKYDQYDSIQDIGNLKVSYEGLAEVNGNTFFGAHLKYANGLGEVFVIDGWNMWCTPPLEASLGSRYVDGMEYTYYVTPQFIPMGDGCVQVNRQFWCVRRRNQLQAGEVRSFRGTISLSEHVENLRELSPEDIDELHTKLGTASLYVEGFEKVDEPKDCSYSITKAKWYIDPEPVGNSCDPNEHSRLARNEKGVFFITDYEDGPKRSYALGPAKLNQTQAYHAEGSGCLAVTNRTEDWNGVEFILDDYALEKCKPYCFQTAVMQNSEDSVTFRMILEYPVSGGASAFSVLDEQTAKRGEWITLCNPAFVVPVSEDYADSNRIYIPENVKVFVDTPGSASDFYADYVALSEMNLPQKLDPANFVPASPASGTDSQVIPRLTQTPEQYDPNGTEMKNLFGPYFRIGGNVSKWEMSENNLREFYQKNVNVMSCRKELTPKDIIYEIDGTNLKLTLDEADPTLSFAEKNGIELRVNPFESDLETTDIMPAEFYSGSETENIAFIDSFIKELFIELKYQYPNLRLSAFDVREDMFSETENNDAYVLATLKAARKYAPSCCKLYLAARGLNNAKQAEKIGKRVEEIRNEGDFIDGIAMKMNRLSLENVNYNGYKEAIGKFRALGLDIAATNVSVCGLEDDNLGQGAGMMWMDFFNFAVRNAENISVVTVEKPVDSAIADLDTDKTGLYAVTVNGGELAPLPWYENVTELLNERHEKIGDVNCDGTVDVADAVLALRFAVADAEAALTDQGVRNADTDRNGKTDEKDAAYILQYLARQTMLPIAAYKQIIPDKVAEPPAN